MLFSQIYVFLHSLSLNIYFPCIDTASLSKWLQTVDHAEVVSASSITQQKEHIPADPWSNIVYAYTLVWVGLMGVIIQNI